MPAPSCAAAWAVPPSCAGLTAPWRCCWRSAPPTCCSTQVLSRRRRQQLLEDALEMRLVDKARLQCDLGNRPALFEQGARQLYAAVQQVGVRRHAIALPEGADQVRGREPGRAADILQLQRDGAIVVDIVGRAFELAVRFPLYHGGRIEAGLDLLEEVHGRALPLQVVGADGRQHLIKKVDRKSVV